MTIKVSVVSIIFRPGYIDTLVQALKDQSMPKDEWEWVVVDDLWPERKELVKNYIGDAFNFRHIPPRQIVPHSATSMAVNTGIIHARGELVYFMVDYVYIHPRSLERHWEIFKRWGPKVMISGPLVDGITVGGKSIWTGSQPMVIQIQDDFGNVVQVPEATPPIYHPLKANFNQATPDNLISIWAQPFIPVWPKFVPPDWRLGAISSVSIARGLCESHDGGWFWAGRNDSVWMEALLNANGFDEAFDGLRGGADGDLGKRLLNDGYRYLVDREIPCIMLPHPIRKKAAPGQTEERHERIHEMKKREENPIPNDYNLREERQRVLGL